MNVNRQTVVVVLERDKAGYLRRLAYNDQYEGYWHPYALKVEDVLHAALKSQHSERVVVELEPNKVEYLLQLVYDDQDEGQYPFDESHLHPFALEVVDVLRAALTPPKEDADG